jgi:putative methionine-R-sulfoxide reductase with GAF domain
MNLTSVFNNEMFKPVHRMVNRLLVYWRDLSLSRKLLIAFSALAFLALVVGVVANVGLYNVQDSYEHALSDGKAMELTARLMANDLLTARQYEKDFFARWQVEGFDPAYDAYVVPNQQAVAEVRIRLGELSAFTSVIAGDTDEVYTARQFEFELGVLNEGIDLYEENFQKAVQAAEERGSQNKGLEGKFNIAVDSLEKRIVESKGFDLFTLGGVPDNLRVEERLNYQKELDTMVITLLQIRRYEKDYFLGGGQEAVDNVYQQVDELKEQIASSEYLGTVEKSQWRDLADRYVVAFEAVVAKDAQIVSYTEAFRESARAMDPLVKKMTNAGASMSRSDVADAKSRFSQTLLSSALTLVIALLVAGFLAVVLSRQITRPVFVLTKVARELEMGDYDAHVDVSSSDEIGMLAHAFNSMSEKLKATIASLARRTQMLATSTDVSRRLSALLTQEELVKEVAEQVQSSFNYYHAQIYLLDEESGDLIMAGGTGTAGQLMLANAHKVLKGKGLVGRAAETNTVVLVSDTLSDPNWLPNRLLPETRAEVAVPILIGTKVMGVLDVQHNVVGGLNQDDADLLLSIANQFAIAVRNARSYTEVQDRAEREALIASIVQKIQNTSTVEGTLQVAVREIGRSLGVKNTRVMLKVSENNERKG